MVERELCKLEVIGSIPFSSTTLRSRSGAKGARRSQLAKAGDASASYGWLTPLEIAFEVRSKRTPVLFLLSSDRKFHDIVKEDLRGLVMRADVFGMLRAIEVGPATFCITAGLNYRPG